MKTIDSVDTINSQISDFVEKYGFEAHPFKIWWYNDCVAEQFRLDYNPESLAFLVISCPQMFEKAFVPFVKANYDILSNSRDPLDQCMQHYFQKIVQLFPKYKVETIHDFELYMPSRRPKVLVQVAAHVSGAAYYYQRRHISALIDDSTALSGKLGGVCLHPKYGGWFALRGVIVFSDIVSPKLKRVLPNDLLSEEEKIDLLSKFCERWQDGTYRDIIAVSAKYSPLQRKYFATNPKDRSALLVEILHL